MTPAPPFNNTPRPWWVDAINRLGVPAVICLVLVYFLMQVVTARLEATQKTLDQHVVEMRGEASATRAEIRDGQDLTNALLFRICLSVAKTDVQRATCSAGAPGR